MDEDDFGDLYDEQQPDSLPNPAAGSLKVFPSYGFSDDEDDDFGFTSTARTPRAHPAKSLETLSPDRAHNPGEQVSDEDEEDMLLLGYDAKSESGLRFVGVTSREPDSRRSGQLTTKFKEKQSTVSGNFGEEFVELSESDRAEEVIEDGLHSLGVGAEQVTGYAPVGVSEKDLRLIIGNSLDNPERSPDINDFTNHTVTIPGLSTTIGVSSCEVEDNDDVLEDDWERKETGRELLQVDRDAAADEADDWDSDSEDDLQIVLNNDHSIYGNSDKGIISRFDGDSEDEDDEDLIIVAGSEPCDDQEWVEEQALPPEGQAGTFDGLTPVVGGDRQTLAGDEKGQQGKALGVGTGQPAGRGGYGYHNYHSPFKYVRPGAAPLYGSASAGQPPGNKANLSKGVSGRGDWRGSGRGSYGSQSGPQAASWGATQFGHEFSLPPSMTVFDIDLDSFDEKPWRHPSVDATDFFNFGFNENTWKEYCKQLAQLRLESTMQSKIRVYESGRSEQEYDPNLPPELVAAAGLHDGTERNQHRQIEVEAMSTLMRRSGGHSQIIPSGRPIQVEGGLGDRRPSADLRRQRARDSDTIILIDAMEEEESEVQRPQEEGHGKRDEDAEEKDEEEEESKEEDEEEEIEEEDEEEEVGNMFKQGLQQNMWREDQTRTERKNVLHGAGFLSSQKGGERRLRSSLDHDELINLSTDHVTQAGPQLGKLSVTSGYDLYSGESINPVHRVTTSRPPTPPETPVEERRELELDPNQHRGPCQLTQSNPKSVNDGDESYGKRQVVMGEKIQSEDGSQAEVFVSPDKSHSRIDQPSGEQEIVIQETLLKDCQGNSTEFSPKRQRLVSPEGSQTASRDDFDVKKSARSVVLRKESADSVESARDGQENDMDGSQSRKHKRQYDINKESQYRDFKEGPEFHNRKQTFVHSRHDFESETNSHVGKIHETRRRPKETSVEKAGVKEPSKHRPKREEDAYIWKKEKEEETRRVVQVGKDRMHNKERAGNRSESRKRDEEDRRDRQSSRKRDDEDRKDRLDRGFRHREKELEASSWHNPESVRRKREEEYRRKDRAEKDEGFHEQKPKEKHGSERHDRDVDLHFRRKEEESLRRERPEEHHRLKARDSSWREREESQRRNGLYQDMHGRTHKDEERLGQGGRRTRHDEERSWHVRDENRINESTRAAEARDHTRDRRKHLDDIGREKSRSHECRSRPVSDREASHLSENVVADAEKLSYNRGPGKHGKLSDEQRTSERRSQSEKQKSDMRRNKEPDRERTDLASGLGEFSDSSKRRTSANGKNEVYRKRSDDLAPANIGAGRAGAKSNHPDETLSEQNLRTEHRNSHLEKFSTKEVSSLHEGNESSEDEEHKQKGRSKLERWMSHKESGYEGSQRLSSEERQKKVDRHQGTSVLGEKHHRDGHNHHLSGTKNDSSHEEQQMADTDRKCGKVSPSLEQENGWVSEPDKKWESRGENDKVAVNLDLKSSVEFAEPQHPEVLSLDMAAKLEKRRERFKVSLEDRDLARQSDNEDYQQTDKEEAKQERPTRKRRWASG